MKASDYIATFIESKGVKNIFELSGGMITHILDSFHLKTKVNIISVHHEQSAAFAADACGRVTGLPGIALATSGPGATNLLTGIGSCYFVEKPMMPLVKLQISIFSIQFLLKKSEQGIIKRPQV